MALIDRYPYLKIPTVKLRLLLIQARYSRRLQQTDEAQKYIDDALLISDYRAFNRFEVQEINFDLQMKKGDYVKAGFILKDVRNAPQYEHVFLQDKAVWYICEAYLYFILKYQNKLSLAEELTPNFRNGFSLRHFVEQTRHIIPDKKGYNVMLLIIKYLFLYKKDEEMRIKEAGNLRIYFHRYLKDIPAERTKSFYKALYRLGRDNFELNKIIEKDIYLHDKFNAMKDNPTYDNLELIPYEVLWEVITKEFLEKKLRIRAEN